MSSIIDKKNRGDAVHVVGADANGDATYFADVEWIDGKPRLLVQADVTVSELLGQDNQADVWFYLGTQYDVGPIAVDDTVRVEIAAGPNASLFPAIDLTYTVVAADVAAANPEIAVANKVVAMLKADVTFKSQWTAQRITDNSTVWIGSKLVGEWSERKNVDDFKVTATGTIGVVRAFDKIERKGKITSLTKDPNDPRYGILGITGTVAQSVEEIGQLYADNLEENPHLSGLVSMNVDGSSTPVVFYEHAVTEFDIYITELRFYSVSAGAKFGQFLNINTPLTNGILVEIKSDDSQLILPVIKTTEDFKNKFAIGGTWSLETQPSATSMTAVFRLTAPFVIRHIGEFIIDDYVRVTVRDDLTPIATLEMLVFGFMREI